ncbi:MAG: hypothetical protein V8T82_11585 [Romboutsia timonensis]
MVLLALIALSILFAIKKLNITNIKKILKYIGINSLYTLVTVGLGYGLSRLLALINGRKFEITYLPLIKFERCYIYNSNDSFICRIFLNSKEIHK